MASIPTCWFLCSFLRLGKQWIDFILLNIVFSIKQNTDLKGHYKIFDFSRWSLSELWFFQMAFFDLGVCTTCKLSPKAVSHLWVGPALFVRSGLGFLWDMSLAEFVGIHFSPSWLWCLHCHGTMFGFRGKFKLKCVYLQQLKLLSLMQCNAIETTLGM